MLMSFKMIPGYYLKRVNVVRFFIKFVFTKRTNMANSKYEVKVFLTLVVLAAVFMAYLLFKPNKAEPPVIKVVDMSELRSVPMMRFGNLPFVFLSIDGKNCAFLVDTGAEESVLNSNLLDSLHVTIADSVAIPNTKISLTNTVHAVSKSDTLFAIDKQFYSYDLDNMRKKLVEVDSAFNKVMFVGIIGQDALRQGGLILNFQNNRMYLTNNVK